MTNSIRIDEFHLRVSGVSREQAKQLGLTVARQLTEQLHAISGSRNLSELRLRLTIPSGTPRERLGSIIAAGILKKIS